MKVFVFYNLRGIPCRRLEVVHLSRSFLLSLDGGEEE